MPYALGCADDFRKTPPEPLDAASGSAAQAGEGAAGIPVVRLLPARLRRAMILNKGPRGFIGLAGRLDAIVRSIEVAERQGADDWLLELQRLLVRRPGLFGGTIRPTPSQLVRAHGGTGHDVFVALLRLSGRPCRGRFWQV